MLKRSALIQLNNCLFIFLNFVCFLQFDFVLTRRKSLGASLCRPLIENVGQLLYYARSSILHSTLVPATCSLRPLPFLQIMRDSEIRKADLFNTKNEVSCKAVKVKQEKNDDGIDFCQFNCRLSINIDTGSGRLILLGVSPLKLLISQTLVLRITFLTLFVN